MEALIRMLSLFHLLKACGGLAVAEETSLGLKARLQ